jgi:hypothetical protein
VRKSLGPKIPLNWDTAFNRPCAQRQFEEVSFDVADQNFNEDHELTDTEGARRRTSKGSDSTGPEASCAGTKALSAEYFREKRRTK